MQIYPVYTEHGNLWVDGTKNWFFLQNELPVGVWVFFLQSHCQVNTLVYSSQTKLHWVFADD